MKIGLHVIDYAFPGGAAAIGPGLIELAETAEEVGFDAFAVADHVWQNPHVGGPERDMLEAYTTLGFIAARTRRMRLLTVVSGNHFRHPGMLVKTVTTLDVLSGGRAWLGIGTGHDAAESAGLGIPMPPLKDRFEQLEETLKICKGMWNGERGSGEAFAGEHFHLERMLNMPQSLTRPHPPILIGGSGEKKTLRLVAQYGDACNLYPMPDMPHKLDVLRRHCEAAGRDEAEIEKTSVVVIPVREGTVDTAGMVEQIRNVERAGIQTVYAQLRPEAGVQLQDAVEAVGREVIPAVAG
jgi:F420-dependent oxidoreductase-like protein